MAALALLISVLVISPVPTNAADPTPDFRAFFDACPEAKIPSVGFTDVPDSHPSVADVDCIAYYGITNGAAPTAYWPDRPVIREHMALFLVRLAKLVGIRVPARGDTPFEDIAHLEDDSRQAIGQIYRLGITIGASPTTYAPERNVTRGEMALFLQRLMDLMVPVADGRIAFGYTPDDVNDNDGNFDVQSPFGDLERVPHAVHAAVTQLYELGVASGVDGLTYDPDADMTRATMAEFMAAILDHSNLRPRGVMVQVTPTQGTDDFEIMMMVSVRDDSFAPSKNVAVDWFYTADPQGGLDSDGACVDDKVLGDGDCVWDVNEDGTTDLDGNLFEDFDATPGATMSIYAWVGDRHGQSFDQDTANYSMARAMSEKGVKSLSVNHDLPATAARIGRGQALVVDLDRRSSVEFSIQLLDADGAHLAKQGVPVKIRVESRAIRVDAEDTRSGRPDPDLFSLGRDVGVDTTPLTDRYGRVTFDLRAPIRGERLDTVAIGADCCSDQIHQIAWSDGPPVLVSASPAFDLYQRREGDRIGFTVQFDLFDQYGETLRSTHPRHTGRPDTDVEAKVEYRLYQAQVPDGSSTYTVGQIADATGTPSVKIDRNRVTSDVMIEIPAGYRDGYDFLVVINTQVFSDKDGDNALDPNEVRYVNRNLIVWVVKDAQREHEFTELQNRNFATPLPLNLEEIELYPSARKFRTFFTLWSYEPTHKFLANDDFVDVETFEKLWQNQVDGLEDFEILLYSPDFSLIKLK